MNYFMTNEKANDTFWYIKFGQKIENPLKDIRPYFFNLGFK